MGVLSSVEDQRRSQSIADALGPGGAIARELGDGYEPRQQQIDMADAVERTLAERGQLMIEAGTGVGKSLGYLLPAVRRIIEAGERVVVATNTIALQEQILSKDLPILERIFEDEDGFPMFRAELVKGRGNYLSVRRLMLASQRQEKLFPDAASKRSLHQIEDWAYDTREGTLSTLPQLERPGVWDHARSDSGNCMGRRCPTYDRCFYQQARRSAESADLLVCNHALFFSDLALRGRGIGFLPPYDHVILDEAHMAEDVASDHFGLSLAEGRVVHLLGTLYRDGRGTGYLASLPILGPDGERVSRAIGLVRQADRARERFFESLADRVGRSTGTLRIPVGQRIENTLSDPFGELAVALKLLRDLLTNDEDRHELNSYIERVRAVADEADALCDQTLDGCVYWIETTRASRGGFAGVRATLSCSPVEVAPILSSQLFNGEQSVVLTSATLTTGSGSFAHAKERLGCDAARTLEVGSPFDHAAQVKLYVEPDLPDPREPNHLRALTRSILRHVLETEGGAFVLFTSFKSMHDAAGQLRGAFEDHALPLWVQGQDGSRQHILERFRGDERSVLFGTSSFWQGVDVRGEGLRNVIITRLPFDPPDRPLTEARGELLRSRGKDPFRDDALPRSVIRFKQGFGRLIRSSTDRGRVVVLDKRIVKSRYGRAFLKALPEGVEPVLAE